ncbi:MAG TPA: sugar kinase [Gemmatimonadales bacterium]|nr:sugar kinase [Gemmatimonadales bacterium]
MTGGARVVTFGEVMLRLSPPRGERLFRSPELRADFGGSEANVAVALAHLDVPVEYVTRLPEGPLGDAALAALAAEGVGTAWVQRGGERLGIYFIEPGADMGASRVVYDRAGSAFASLNPTSVDWVRVLEGARWFHGSGITPALGDGPRAALGAAITAARGQAVAVSLDLNYRPALWQGRDPRAVIGPLVEGIDLLIGNRDAIRAMLGVEAEDPSVAAQLVARFGCRRVAITRREVVSATAHGWSAELYDGPTGAAWASRRYERRVVDRVGGGDSFAAGLIAALLAERPPEAAVEFAAAAGALKLSVAGDWNRATPEEVDRLVRACT